MSAVFSIGYEGLALDELIARLGSHRIDRVIDVRELPLSRRPGFSKTPLGAALAAAGIDYVHLREAGNPYRRDKDHIERRALLARYRAHLNAARATVRRVADVARDHRAALLCYEADVASCHRSILGPRVARSLGVSITNL